MSNGDNHFFKAIYEKILFSVLNLISGGGKIKKAAKPALVRQESHTDEFIQRWKTLFQIPSLISSVNVTPLQLKMSEDMQEVSRC